MSKQPYMQFILNGVAMRSVGYKTPSPLVAIQLVDAENGSQTNFTVTFHIPGSQEKQAHITSFETMLYEFAQMRGDAVTPCYIEIGWCEDGQVTESLKVQGLFIQFKATVHTGYMEYVCQGTGNFTNFGNVQGLAIPAIRGNYKPSEVLEAVLNYIQANDVFDYDIDHDDEVVPINMSAQVTSLGDLVFGSGSRTGLLQQAYCAGSKSSAYRLPGKMTIDDYKRAGYSNSQIRHLLGPPLTQTQRSASAYSFSIVEPTFYNRGTIRYKNNVNLANYVSERTLIWGGLHTNIISITATYNGLTQQILGSGHTIQTGIGLTLDGEVGVNTANRQNDYSATVPSMYNAGNVLNNLNAISTQFNTDIRVTIVGSPLVFQAAESVRLVVYTGGTLNQVTGIYRVLKVTHQVTGTSYTTELTLKRLDLVSANNTALSMSGYTNPVKTDGKVIAAIANTKLNLGPSCQNITNLMRRGTT